MRSKIILVAAILMGAITTILFFNYMKQFDEKKIEVGETVEVVAAKQEIKANTIVTASMLQMIEIPMGGAHESSLRSADAAIGKLASSTLMPGEVLLPHHVLDQKLETVFVSKKIKEGYRAVSVGLNLIESVTNLIEPEDYVDVVVTREDKKIGEVKTSVVLENVRVLAIGRRMVEANDGTLYVEYESATLEVLKGDGVKIIDADKQGEVSLMLHSRVVAK